MREADAEVMSIQSVPTQNVPAQTHTGASRLGILERKDAGDFPYYNGLPVTISTWRWIAVIASTIVGFALLILLPQPNDLVALEARVLFTAVPLGAFIFAAGPCWRAILRPLRARDIRAMFGFAALNMVVTAGVGIVVAQLFGANANRAIDGLAGSGPVEYVAFYVGTGIQLVGEELFTILPMLALMYWLHAKLRMNRTTVVLVAWIVTAVWFAAAHLPTYGWNVAQALLIIGTARLVLTLAYIRTKNIGVSVGAHIINDWTQFTLAMVIAAVAAS